MRTFEIVTRNAQTTPKLTVAKNRFTLKIPSDLTEERKQYFIRVAQKIDGEIPEVRATLRGGFHRNGSIVLQYRSRTRYRKKGKKAITVYRYNSGNNEVIFEGWDE